MDGQGVITDRRAGRIPTEEGARLCDLLKANVKLPGVELFLVPEKEYRFVFVIRGEGFKRECERYRSTGRGKKAYIAEATAPEPSEPLKSSGICTPG